MKHCYLLASEKACPAARSIVVTLLILGRLPRAAAPAAPRTPSGFGVFSEISLLFAGRAWTPDRSAHKLKIKLKDDPLLSLSAQGMAIARSHVVVARAGQRVCRSATVEIQRRVGFIHVTHSTEHLSADSKAFVRQRLYFIYKGKFPLQAILHAGCSHLLGQLYSRGTVAIASFKKFFFPSIPALLCNRDGTELCLFLSGLR